MWLAFATFVIWLVSPAMTQDVPSVIQLPSFGTFSYSGSVLVPDSGGAYLGGVNRSAMGVNRRGFGPFQNRAFGGVASSNSLTAHAKVIDLAEMDRQILGYDPANPNARPLARHLAAGAVDPMQPGGFQTAASASGAIPPIRGGATDPSTTSTSYPSNPKYPSIASADSLRRLRPQMSNSAESGPARVRTSDGVGTSGDPDRQAKAMVRLARKKFSQGDRRGAAIAYDLAIQKLNGRLRDLAIAEYRRQFGIR